MPYLVLARKYRPQKFDEVIGQEHISELLKKAIESGRLAQAYLFSGPRGIGKTSCARILAKSLNCANGPTLNPCGQCSSCKEITAGNSFDVLEIDGASNRGIDEIRALRENVKFAPSYGRYKIYIVDEVHMLTTEAFNALLKTLEEPPPHVKFIFATTAPNKVPSTIISRCQRFDFKRISINTTVEVLNKICQIEKLRIEPGALYAIAKAAEGSLRDALSILDQISALGNDGIAAEDVTLMLGLVETQLLFDMSEAISQKNCVLALEKLEAISDQGKDLKQFVRDIIEHFRNLMIIKIGGKTLGKMVDYPADIKEILLTQSQQFTLKDILTAIDIFIETQDIARITESLQLSIEMALAKLTYRESPEMPPTAPPLQNLNAAPKPKLAGQAVQPALKSQKGQIIISGEIPLPEVPKTTTEDLMPEPPLVSSPLDVNIARIKQIWDNLTYAVSREKMSLATCLQEGTPIEYKDSQLLIAFPDTCKFQKETVDTISNIKLVERIFSEKIGQPIRIVYKVIIKDAAQKEEDPAVKNVINEFRGTIVNRWHND